MRSVLLAAVILPLVSFASPPDVPRESDAKVKTKAGPKLSAADRRERAKTKLVKKTRLRHTLRIAEVLELSEEDALRLSETLSRFDGQRAQLIDQMMSAGMTLRSAARGEADSYGEIDRATRQFVEAKAGLVELDRQMLEAIATEFELSPREKARVALSFGPVEPREHRGARPHPR